MARKIHTITINTAGLRKFQTEIDAQLNSGSQGPVNEAVFMWGIRYRTFLQERFDKFSKGGGNWRALRPGVRAAKIKAGYPDLILRRTELLFHAFDPIYSGSKGQYQERVRGGIRIGISNDTYPESSGTTIADVLSWHQTGAGNLPQRKVIVRPPRDVVDLMIKDMEDAIAQVAEQTRSTPPQWEEE